MLTEDFLGLYLIALSNKLIRIRSMAFISTLINSSSYSSKLSDISFFAARPFIASKALRID